MAQTSSDYVAEATSAVLPLGFDDEARVSHPSPRVTHARVRQHRQIVVIGPLGYAIAKRAFDIGVALVLLTLTSPLWLLVAVLIWSTSPGPIVFRQVRCGRHGKPFVCFKFRTMVPDAQSILERDARLQQAFGAAWKLYDDPRVTRLGRWLRKLSIDELPQLVNVLRGEMSVVGPRPVLPVELEQQYGASGRAVTSVRPGITGLWQVSGRSLVSYERRIALDLEYLRRQSFWFDLVLVLRTLPAVFRRRETA